MNKANQTETNIGTENRVVVTRGEGGWGKGEMGKGG